MLKLFMQQMNIGEGKDNLMQKGFGVKKRSVCVLFIYFNSANVQSSGKHKFSVNLLPLSKSQTNILCGLDVMVFR